MKTSTFKTFFISAMAFVSLQSCTQDELPETTPPTQIQAVFMGNSITQSWSYTDAGFFTQNNYVGKGISGQVSAQMLARMENDVVKLKPLAVVINAGINDIAERDVPYNANNTFDNIKAMAQVAQSNNIKVILSSVLPCNLFMSGYGSSSINDVAIKVIALNTKIKEYAKANNIPYIDYHSALKNNNNGLDAKYGNDGLHPNLAGYRVMEPLAKQAIDKALQ